MARFRSVAITCGPLPVRTWLRSSPERHVSYPVQTHLDAPMAAEPGRQLVGAGLAYGDDAHPSCPELLIEFPHLVAGVNFSRCGLFAARDLRVGSGLAPPGRGPASGGSIRMARSVKWVSLQISLRTLVTVGFLGSGWWGAGRGGGCRCGRGDHAVGRSPR